jgi:signal transduction histidine kinase
MWAIAGSLTAAACVFAVSNGLTGLKLVEAFIPALVLSSLSYATVGLLVALHHTHHPIGWLLLAMGVTAGLAAFTGQFARYALLTSSPPLVPIGLVAAWLYNWVWLLTYWLAAALLLRFPTGRLKSPRWQYVMWLATAGAVLAVIGRAFGVRADPGLPEVRNPFGFQPGAYVLGLMAGIGFPILILSLLGGVVAVLARFRSGTSLERQQLKLFVLAGALVIVGESIAPRILAELRPDLASNPFAYTEPFVTWLPAVAVGLAIMRYRLYDIDRLIWRTLTYAVLTACIVALYALVVTVLGSVLRGANEVLGPLVATGLIVVLFQPLQRWLQRGVSRLMFGQRDEPYAVLSSLSRQLELAAAPNTILPLIAETVARALKLPYAAVALEREGHFEIVGAYGESRGEALRMPLVYQRSTVGELILSPRAPGEGFGRADRRLLEDLTRQAGVAAHAVRVTADLQHSRERLVSAREEERRRMQRDLHDGLGPALSSTLMKLSMIKRQLDTNSPIADEIEDAGEDMRRIVAEIRRLVYQLRPPSLDHLGLENALRELAEQLGHSAALCVTIAASEPLPALPAAVEVAAYRIVQEALTNVVKHARARRCSVELTLQPTGSDKSTAAHLAETRRLAPSWGGTTLHIEVCDDGTGIGPDVQSGVGLHSMRERAEELGGQCVVARGSVTGTRVIALLPLGNELE